MTGAKDKRCLLEAPIAEIKPIFTECHAVTIDQADNGAAEQLARALSKVLLKKSQ